MKTKLYLLPLIFVVACSGVKVLNVKPEAGFALSNYKTFDFLKLEGSGDTSANFSKNAELLKQEIAGRLQSKGLTQTTSSPDLLINIGIIVDEKIQTRETDLWEAPRYMGQRNYSWKREEVEVGRYKLGTITVHLVDAATNNLMWKGAVEGVVPAKEEKIPLTIQTGVEKLLDKL